MKLSFKNVLPILLIFTLLILFAGCFTSPEYTPPTYSVTYDGNGNTGGVVPTDANLYEEDASVTVLGNTGILVRTGYTFDDWNTAADGSGGANQAAGDTFIMGTVNVTLYAQWIKNENPAYTPTPTVYYNLTMAADPIAGGTATDDTAAGPYAAGTVVSISAAANGGYEFDGWTAPAGTFGDAGLAGTTFTMPAQDVTVTANFVNAAVGYILNGSEHQSDWEEGYLEGTNTNDGSQSMQTTHLCLEASKQGTAERTYVTKVKVDLTCVNSIVIEWENTGADDTDNESYLIVSSTKTDSHDTYTLQLKKERSFIKQFNTLDVSTLAAGSYYIRVHARDDGQGGDSALKVYSIELK
jgi:uncharacterized repeat protein (TIGR02543 family)